MRALYAAARRLRSQPLTENVAIAIGALAALAVLAIDIAWGLPA